VKSRRLGRWINVTCWGFGLAMVLVISSDSTVRSQSGSMINRPALMPTDPTSSGDYDLTLERRQIALNIERQKEMVSDTNKLLRLARELNEEVAANNSSGLTEDQIHKIAQIEKLARSVKEKMADGTGQPIPAMEMPVALPAH